MCMKLYIYSGPVLYFNKCVADHWFGSTYAPTKKKARSNLEYRFKKENNYTPNVKIHLPGDIIEEERI